MKAKFISHPDFANLDPINIYHKQFPKKTVEDAHPEEYKNRHVVYRRHVTLKKDDAHILKITADDHYKLYINGRFVTEGPFPIYPKYYEYAELDVSDYIKDGENVFAVHCYYQGDINHVWVSGDLLQMLWLSLSEGGREVLVSDESWLVKYHTGYSALGYFGYHTAYAECYDCTSPDRDIYECDFDESGFTYAVENKNSPWRLHPQTSLQLEYSTLLPSSIERHPFGLRITFPTEAVGYLTARAKGQRGDTVVMHFAEEMNPDGSPRYNMRCNCRYEEKWILSGEWDTLYQYDYKAFRYVDLIIPDGVTLEDVKMTVRHYPYEKRGSYSEARGKLADIIALCENTIKYGTQEHYLDCPTREKGAYLGDAMVSGRAHAILTGDASLLKHTVRAFSRTADICPGLMTAYGSLMQEIADYSLEFPALLAWIYDFDGDRNFLAELEPTATGVYEHFKKFEGEDGLLADVFDKWNLVDWPSNLRDGYDFELTQPVAPGKHNVINALWYGCKLALTEIYSILGYEGDIGLDKTLHGFRELFYDENKGLFRDAEGSSHHAVHSQIFPLLFGMEGDDLALRARLASAIEEKGLYSMGVYVAYFALAALRRIGEDELVKKLTLDDRCWLNMLKEGASTTFEAWGLDQKSNSSAFHPWATAPLVIFADGVRYY